jgi:protocatechuate 3,4-dioxygenase, beta subunit
MKTICLLLAIAVWPSPAAQAPTVAEKNAPSTITVAARDEPGERLIVAGRVFGADGVTALAGASVYVYHTDVKGYYSPGTNDNRKPRLRGYMRTDAQGRYEFSTIKPGPYPNSRIPAHIHYVVTAAGFSERIFEIVFEGDPHLDDRVRREAANEWSGFSLRRLEKDNQGAWRCTQDVKLRR